MNGRIIGISGPTVVVDVPSLCLYERVVLGDQHVMGEVVRLAHDRAVVQVYESTRGLRLHDIAASTGSELTVGLGPDLLSRTFDGLQRPLDGGPPATGAEWPVRVPRPYRRKLTQVEPLATGQRVIDFLFPLARGGTAIMPGGFGTGKTVLQQAIAKFADVDIVIYVGCGERGNEMAEMLDEFAVITDPRGERPLMARTIVVVNTSNMPVAAREASIYTAMTMAEHYRDMGQHVLLLADSLSRWAEALREISSALEEMPGEEGYPTHLGSRMAGFFARAGLVETLGGKIGSVTLVLSVSPPGGDFTEPVTQACLRTTGAFLMLDTQLAHRRHFPAINWFQSFSLYAEPIAAHFDRTVGADWSALRQRTRGLLQQEQQLREVAEIVGTEGLQDSDRLTMRVAGEIRRDFLAQNAYSDDACSSAVETRRRIASIFESYDTVRARLEKGERLDAIVPP
jgi:V/A-type H+-transporting ATPase subunit A